MKLRVITAALFLSLTVPLFAAPKKEDPRAAQSIPELQQQIEKILKDTHTPAASVAIVHKDGPEWVTALGIANVAANQPATADTLFRIGSTSKAFASLSILKLVREGRLSLDDPIHKLVPDLGYDNKWESSDPIRVVHLLEHTTGWDDMHLREYAKQADGMDLRTALDYGRSSRVARWRPGTRMSYCNTGPAVAAYIIEHVTGQRFEDYVRQNFFTPIGMTTATYFLPTANAVTLYHGDGKTPYSYWHILYRPAGSINASAKDMAAYVQFYLNRGTVNSVAVSPASDIDRMENPTSTWAAHDGLKAGYGLSNYWSFQDGYVYHGHNGGVEGGLTELAYIPDAGVGYVFSINSGNGDAFGKISKAIQKYITLKLPRPAVQPAVPVSLAAESYAGWYQPDSPRQEMMRFMEKLTGLSRVTFQGGQMHLRGLGAPSNFVPVSDRLFRFVPKEGAPEPVASAALLSPNAEGQFIYAGAVLKRIPAWMAFTQIGLTALVLLCLIAIVLYAPFWIVGGLIRRRRRPVERGLRLYPLLAVLSLVAFVAIIMLSSTDAIRLLGTPTASSVGLCLATLAFAALTLLSTWAVVTARPEVRRSVRWFSGFVSLGLLIALVYLAYWGVIGIRTWV